MKWKKYTVETTTAAEDIVISTLAEIGIQGVEILDKQPLTAEDKKQMFVDILPDSGEDDGIAHLCFYLEPEEDCRTILENVRQELEDLRMFMDIGSGSITEDETEDKDWINNWKEYFKQFTVDRIRIAPSWEEADPETPDEILLRLDPGTAFGTGMHETTQLCMKQLLKYVKKDMQVLDIGTGSGILAILALKLGAANAVGTDLDPCAVSAVAENKEGNGIADESFEMLIGNLIDDTDLQKYVGYDAYDLITANILAEVLVDMTPAAVNHLKPGGIYITSGILDIREELVKEAVAKAGLELVEVTHQGEWVAVTARKPFE